MGDDDTDPGAIGSSEQLRAAARDKVVRYFQAESLSDITRRTRRMLVLSSAVLLAMAWVELVPTEIAAIGVSFSETNQDVLMIGTALVVLYFLLMFWVQASKDSLSHRLAWVDMQQSLQLAGMSLEDLTHELVATGNWVNTRATQLNWVVDYRLPIGVGLGAFGSAVYKTVTPWL